MQDIEFRDAIHNVLSSCADGVLRTSKPDQSVPTPYAEFQATITMAANHSRIVDNCGGIPIDTATKYAFASLRDDAAFQATAVGDWSWSVYRSDDVEILSDALWRMTLEQGTASLRARRLDHNIAQTDAASAPGVGLRMWRCYEAGEHAQTRAARERSRRPRGSYARKWTSRSWPCVPCPGHSQTTSGQSL